MLPYNQMAMTANPTTENVPLKRGEITGVETISLLYCRSGGFFLPPPFSLVPAVIHMFILSFIIHHFLLLLTAGDCQKLPYMTVEEISHIFSPLE